MKKVGTMGALFDTHICTKDDPWTKAKSSRAQHPDAVSEGDTYDWSADHDDYETFKCPHCGLRFRVPIPC
jgi:hypothetical protein